MSDSIIVRVSLNSYDFAHPSERQTQVYVQIPEAARASWLLPAERYHGLKDRAWPEVLDVAQEHAERGWAVTAPAAAARATVAEWLRDAANRDEMQAAFEEDRAKRDPVTRKLLARVAELEAQRAALAVRLRAGQRWRQGRTMPLVSQDNVSQDELRTIFGIRLTAPWDAPAEDPCHPCGCPKRFDRHAYGCPTVAPETGPPAGESADKLTRLLAPTQALREDEPAEAQPLMVFRASHDSIVFGLYTTADAAREHCETLEQRDLPGASFDWIEDEEDGVAELVAAFGEDERPTGYVVTSLEVASEYDPDGDE